MCGLPASCRRRDRRQVHNTEWRCCPRRARSSSSLSCLPISRSSSGLYGRVRTARRARPLRSSSATRSSRHTGTTSSSTIARRTITLSTKGGYLHRPGRYGRDLHGDRGDDQRSGDDDRRDRHDKLVHPVADSVSDRHGALGDGERCDVAVQRRHPMRHADRQYRHGRELHSGGWQHMVTARESHDVAVLAPWYVTGPQNVAIHRYLDPGFVAQFQADVSSAPQNNAHLFDWQSEDQVSATDTRLKLRRPVHRTFHMVAWEASCKMATAPAGYPAIAPEKIASAGFVLRDVSDATGFSRWASRSSKASRRVGRRSHCLTADPDAARHVKSLVAGSAAGHAQPRLHRRGDVSPASAFGHGGRQAAHTCSTAISRSEAATTCRKPHPPLSQRARHRGIALAIRPGRPPRRPSDDLHVRPADRAAARFSRRWRLCCALLLGRYQLVDPDAWDPGDANAQHPLDRLAHTNQLLSRSSRFSERQALADLGGG